MTINRRAALGLFGGGAAAPAMAATATVYGGPVRFGHGVASGDPGPRGVMVWTRVTPLESTTGEIPVRLEVATDPQFKALVHTNARLTAKAARDFTVKYDLTDKGLKAGTEYWYRFSSGKTVSPVGRTKTLPVGDVEDVVLAVASCTLYPSGYFNAYGAMASLERLDAVLHLGDYFYEYGAAPGDYGMNSPVAAERPHDPPHELVKLEDYRRRHAQYKSDPQLQAAHARAPWIVVWDDHEIANDGWLDGAQNHNPEKGEGNWAERKAAALRAYFEWMPLREPAAGRGLESIWRAFRFGNLASLMMLETRLTARSQQLDYMRDMPMVDGKPDVAAFRAKWSDPKRRLICAEQERWLKTELEASVANGCAWEVIGNQTVLARISAPDLKATLGESTLNGLLADLPAGAQARVKRLMMLGSESLPYNLDAWDGYPAARERVLALLKSTRAHPIMLAGDTHNFWVNEVHEGELASSAKIAAEIGTTSITSPGAGDAIPTIALGEAFTAENPDVVYSHQSAKGFARLTLTRNEARADLMRVSTIHNRTYQLETLKSFRITPAEGGGIVGVSEV